MIIYHGSNVVVEMPEIRSGLRAMDFGSGFYTTSSLEQAANWARSVTRRRRSGKPVVSVYLLDEEGCQKLTCLKFESACGEWLDFVVNNRRGICDSSGYDLVIGPVADDSTIRVIDDYMDGYYTKDEAISHLLPQVLKDQYAFLSNASLMFLKFKEFCYV